MSTREVLDSAAGRGLKRPCYQSPQHQKSDLCFDCSSSARLKVLLHCLFTGCWKKWQDGTEARVSLLWFTAWLVNTNRHYCCQSKARATERPRTSPASFYQLWDSTDGLQESRRYNSTMPLAALSTFRGDT